MRSTWPVITGISVKGVLMFLFWWSNVKQWRFLHLRGERNAPVISLFISTCLLFKMIIKKSPYPVKFYDFIIRLLQKHQLNITCFKKKANNNIINNKIFSQVLLWETIPQYGFVLIIIYFFSSANYFYYYFFFRNRFLFWIRLSVFGCY